MEAQRIKEAKSFIIALRKKKSYLEQQEQLMRPLLDKLGVRSEWDAPQEYWQSAEWRMSTLRLQVRALSSKVMRLNVTTKRLKYSFWALHPEGTDEYYAIFPKQVVRS